MSKPTLDDAHSLSHTKWNCKYHVVFAPKYRRKAFYGERRLDIGGILRKLCEWKGVNILEAEVCLDHVHMLLEIPPKMSVSSFMGYLKGKSSLMIYEKWGNARYQYRNREFWCRGYYVDTVGKNIANNLTLFACLTRRHNQFSPLSDAVSESPSMKTVSTTGGAGFSMMTMEIGMEVTFP